MTEIEQLRAERDELAAHVERLNKAGIGLRNLMALSGSSAEHYLSQMFDALDEAPQTSLARLKAQWQAEAVKEAAGRFSDYGMIGCGNAKQFLSEIADKYRCQAEGQS